MNGKNYLIVQPPGISMGAFETPIGGISLGDQMYVVVRTNHASDWSMDRSVLTHFTLPSTFQPVRTISQALGLWLMTFDSRPPGPAGIQFCYSKTPWGPWSAAQTIFEEVRDGALGKFIHDPKIKPDGGLEGPVIGTGQADPAAVKGGTYAPYVVERWTKIQGKELNLYYVLSTWNPYVVTLMKSRLQIT
jgi:hypothetical protein